MTYGAMPASLRGQAGVKVRIRETAAQFVGDGPGWCALNPEHAAGMASFCEDNGQADRRQPWDRGERIALQALGRQIRAAIKGRK